MERDEATWLTRLATAEQVRAVPKPKSLAIEDVASEEGEALELAIRLIQSPAFAKGLAVRMIGSLAERGKASRRNIADAGLDDWVEVIAGDAFETLARLDGPYDVVFLDAWKDDYEALFALARARADAGAVVVADNVVSHPQLAAYSAARQADPTAVSVTVPLDSGLEVTTLLTGGLHSG